MDRRQIAAVLTLKWLGVEFKLETFTDRLIAQKAIYLAQTVGADLGYFYGWYLRGPYCPALTEDLFGAVATTHQLVLVYLSFVGYLVQSLVVRVEVHDHPTLRVPAVPLRPQRQ